MILEDSVYFLKAICILHACLYYFLLWSYWINLNPPWFSQILNLLTILIKSTYLAFAILFFLFFLFCRLWKSKKERENNKSKHTKVLIFLVIIYHFARTHIIREISQKKNEESCQITWGTIDFHLQCEIRCVQELWKASFWVDRVIAASLA